MTFHVKSLSWRHGNKSLYVIRQSLRYLRLQFKSKYYDNSCAQILPREAIPTSFPSLFLEVHDFSRELREKCEKKLFFKIYVTLKMILSAISLLYS